MGLKDGALVGDVVGICDGDDVGRSVGPAVGLDVGDEVGETVGQWEGDIVGSFDGRDDGVRVGDMVGESEGLIVDPCIVGYVHPDQVGMVSLNLEGLTLQVYFKFADWKVYRCALFVDDAVIKHRARPLMWVGCNNLLLVCAVDLAYLV